MKSQSLYALFFGLLFAFNVYSEEIEVQSLTISRSLKSILAKQYAILFFNSNGTILSMTKPSFPHLNTLDFQVLIKNFLLNS
jgi:hypothetical protein